MKTNCGWSQSAIASNLNLRIDSFVKINSHFIALFRSIYGSSGTTFNNKCKIIQIEIAQRTFRRSNGEKSTMHSAHVQELLSQFILRLSLYQFSIIFVLRLFCFFFFCFLRFRFASLVWHSISYPFAVCAKPMPIRCYNKIAAAPRKQVDLNLKIPFLMVHITFTENRVAPASTRARTV